MSTFIYTLLVKYTAFIRQIYRAFFILLSGQFDATWYRRQRPHLPPIKGPALFQFLRNDCREDASRDFCAFEYLTQHPHAQITGYPALLHYLHFGQYTLPARFFLDRPRPVSFPATATEFTCSFPIRPPHHRRTAIFASYSGNGRVAPYIFHYLQGLLTVCDNIVFVTDNPLFPSEKEKLAPLVSVLLVSRHGEYDFGSYKRGYLWAKQHDLLTHIDELVVCNDSCYGPFHPFTTVFNTMQNRTCDFWGLTRFVSYTPAANQVCEHLQSFFYVFRQPVFTSTAFHNFLEQVHPMAEPVAINTILYYECDFTHYLEQAGFTSDSLVPADYYQTHQINPFMQNAQLMAHHGMPLMKVKTTGDTFGASYLSETLQMAQRLNPALYTDLLPHFQPKLAVHQNRIKQIKRPKINLQAHQARLPYVLESIRHRLAQGAPIRCTFLIQSPSCFPTRHLFQAMLQDTAFAPRLVVIPEFTAPYLDAYEATKMDAITAELQSEFPNANVCCARLNASPLTPWLEVTLDSEVVFYNTPFNTSHPFYHTRFAYTHDFLPILLHADTAPTIEPKACFQMDAYAYCWKVFFENDSAHPVYQQASPIGGTNGLVLDACRQTPTPILKFLHETLLPTPPLPRRFD